MVCAMRDAISEVGENWNYYTDDIQANCRSNQTKVLLRSIKFHNYFCQLTNFRNNIKDTAILNRDTFE